MTRPRIRVTANSATMSIVKPTTMDEVLRQVAHAETVAVELEGTVDMPPLPASRTIDGAVNGILSESDGSDFSANLWSASLPHGFALCERRTTSPYDADALEFFKDLAAIEEQYAKGLQKLSERVTREPDGGHYDLVGAGSGATNPGGGTTTTGWRFAGFGRGWRAPCPAAGWTMYGHYLWCPWWCPPLSRPR